MDLRKGGKVLAWFQLAQDKSSAKRSCVR